MFMEDNLDQITKDISRCQACELRASATRPVPGLGEVGAKYFLIGEAPGHDEDEQGVPFIGAAGRRLDKLIALAGIDPSDCYISNVCRCLPPKVGGKRRTPRKREIAACVDFLWGEINLVKPQYIITLGATPLALFTKSGGVSQIHGTMFETDIEDRTVTIICQYHPAAALHQPRLWATILDDWENLPEVVPHDFKITTRASNVFDSCGLFGFDTEQDGTGGLGQWSVAARSKAGQLYVLPRYGVDKGFRFSADAIIAAHNWKYDLRVLRANGMQEPKNFCDTMILAYAMGLGKQAPKDDAKKKSGSDMVGGLGLKYLARRHLAMQMNTWQEVHDRPDLIEEYNAKDSVATFLLAEKWLPKAPKHYFDIDMPLLSVLMAIEDRGVKIDPDYLMEFAKSLDNKLAEFDIPLNPFSPKQVGAYVYGKLGIEPWRYTETGQPSTDEEVLETIDDPIVKQILAYKKVHKEKGTYVDNYVNARDAKDRIHPELKQTSTSTGRLSCARPNLQNVFKRDERVKLRSLFVADKGKKIVRADYNQLDYRALAAITQDPVLIEALNADKKIHQVTADIMGLSYDDAKTVNFGVLFGQEAWGLSQQLHITIDEARAFLKDYFKRFPNIKKYRDEMTETAKKDKKVSIPFTGRTRRIDAMYVDMWRVQKQGIKEAINMPVQGLEAEVVKLGMIDLHKRNAPMILMVHDEIIFEVDEKDALEYAMWLKSYIPTIISFGGVRFEVEVGLGNNWYESMTNTI